MVQGVLLGLVVEDQHEITNFFPSLSTQKMMVPWRSPISDGNDAESLPCKHWPSPPGLVPAYILYASPERSWIFSFSYQDATEEPAVLIYDNIKTSQGSLSLKAYMLTPKLMEVCKEKDFSPEALKRGSITFEHMFEEAPIIIHSWSTS